MKHPNIKVNTFLENLSLFKEMSEREIERIAKGTTALHAPKGEIIFHKGDPCTGFHTVVYGQVKLGFTSTQGAEKVIEILGPNQSFGEAVMFLDKPYVVFAQALADTMLLHVSKDVVFEELGRDPAFARKMLAGLSMRLHGLIKDVEAYSLRSGAQRVIGYLLRHEPEGQTGGEFQLMLPTGKGVIASRLNLTPEHFSRVLHELSEAGMIAVEGKTVHIRDVEKLRAYEV